MLDIRRLTATNLPFVLRLCAQAGWNQTEADLRRFLVLSRGSSFLAELAGEPAGTVCTFIFGSTAWIALMLVEESLRGRGIGKALMQHALAHLDENRVDRIRLDATPQGRPLYETLGFIAEYNVLRYAGELTRVEPSPTSKFIVEPAQGRLEQVRRLDTAATAADRSALLRELYRSRARFRMIERAGQVEGYVSYRPGARAWHIGPCVASDSGGLLLDWAFDCTQEMSVYIDIPENNRASIVAAEARGLRVQRTLTRMCRGPCPAERTEMLWASSGPEKG